MPKKKKPVAATEEATPTEVVETTTASTTEETTAKVDEPTEVVVVDEPKLRDCFVMEDHKAIIAGKSYNLKKDDKVSLPEDVAAILAHSGKVRKF